MSAREVLGSAPSDPDAIVRAKLLARALDPSVELGPGATFDGRLRGWLRSVQVRFDLGEDDERDGALDRRTLDLLAWFVAARRPQYRDLPLVAASGAVIPYRTGTVALEVHLGLRPWSQTDDAQLPRHRTVIPAGHPWHPSRYHRASPPSVDWGYGALGTDDPDEEQWYCGALWPYAGDDTLSRFGGPAHAGPPSSAYRHRRVLVHHERTGREVVLCPVEFGPNRRTTGHVAGISPDAAYTLGFRHGEVCWLGWVPDATPLGPP